MLGKMYPKTIHTWNLILQSSYKANYILGPLLGRKHTRIQSLRKQTDPAHASGLPWCSSSPPGLSLCAQTSRGPLHQNHEPIEQDYFKIGLKLRGLPFSGHFPELFPQTPTVCFLSISLIVPLYQWRFP